MSLDTQINVAFNGDLYSRVIGFSLKECMGAHAIFEVSIRGSELEQNLEGSSIMESSRQYLGKRFSLQILPSKKTEQQTLYFYGVVTNIRGTKGKEKGGLGDIVHLTGLSYTANVRGFS